MEVVGGPNEGTIVPVSVEKGENGEAVWKGLPEEHTAGLKKFTNEE
jgi:hypothetical protein